jgi:hypothetical protein
MKRIGVCHFQKLSLGPGRKFQQSIASPERSPQWFTRHSHHREGHLVAGCQQHHTHLCPHQPTCRRSILLVQCVEAVHDVPTIHGYPIFASKCARVYWLHSAKQPLPVNDLQFVTSIRSQLNTFDPILLLVLTPTVLYCFVMYAIACPSAHVSMPWLSIGANLNQPIPSHFSCSMKHHASHLNRSLFPHFDVCCQPCVGPNRIYASALCINLARRVCPLWTVLLPYEFNNTIITQWQVCMS